MIRSVVFSTILLACCSFAQSAWFGGIAVLGVAPDVGLVVLIWLSYKNGLVEGPASGFLSGFVEDFLSASPLGFHAFIKTAVASAAALLHGSFYIDRLLLPVALGAAGTLAKAIVAGALHVLFGDKIHIYSIIDAALWIEAAYNGLLSPIVFLLLTPLSRFLVTERGRR
jgi:rod shape-determining protein MreD